MTSDEKTKFLRTLRKQMKHGATAGERVQATKLYFELVGTNDDTASPSTGIKGTGDVELPPMQQRPPSEYDAAAAQAMRFNPAPIGLSCLLDVLQEPRWMAGSWCVPTAEGWLNAKDHRLLSYDEARVLVADRINELGLNPDLVYSYPETRMTIVGESALWNLTFEERIERFR